MSLALALGVISPNAWAQGLDLSTPAAPRPEDARAAMMLASTLDDEVTAIRAGRPATDLGADALDASLRVLARDLLRAGASRGVDGSDLVLLGATLASGRDDAGAWFDSAGVPALAIAAAARRVDALGSTLPAPDAPLTPDAADAVRRGLRAALAPIAESAGDPAGARASSALPASDAHWWREPTLAASLADAQSRWSGDAPAWLAPESRDALKRLNALFALARTSPAHADAAALIEAHSSLALALADAPPTWLGPSAVQSLRDACEAAVRAAAPPENASGDAAPLARLAAWAEVMSLVARLPVLPATGVGGAGGGGASPASQPASAIASRGPTATLGQFFADILREPIPASLRRARLVRTLTLAALEPEADESQIPRQLRVAMRQLEPVARQSRRTLHETLDRALNPQTTLTDPAVLGAMAAHRRRVDDVALLRAAAGVLVAPAKPSQPGAPAQPAQPAAPASPSDGPRVRPDMNAAAAFLLRVGQDLAKPPLRDVALAEMRDATRALSRGWNIPDEARWRDALATPPGSVESTGNPVRDPMSAPIDDTVGDRTGDAFGTDPHASSTVDGAHAAFMPDIEAIRATVARLDAQRAAALLAFADPRTRDLRAPALELDALASAFALASQCRVDPRDLALARAWPGFELSEQAEATLRASAERALSEVWTIAAASGDGGSVARLTAATTRARAATLPWRVVCAMARSARAARPASPADSTSSADAAWPDALAEPTAVPSGGSAAWYFMWLGESRADAAAFARFAEEWALASAAGERSAAAFEREMLAAARRIAPAVDLDE